jgi:hypothetical protein
LHSSFGSGSFLLVEAGVVICGRMGGDVNLAEEEAARSGFGRL